MKNKRLVALMGCAILVFTSMTAFAQGSLQIGPAVDVIASATSGGGSSEPEPAPSTPSTPSKPSTPVVFTETSADINRLLALNSVGGDVALLQTLLNEAGYNLKVDGIFGPKTLAAVEDFQAKNGLKVDGIVGPKTLAVLAPAVEEAPEVEEPAEPEVEVPEEPVEEEVDVVTTASVVADPEAFEKAMGTAENGGTWIIAALNDLTFDKEIVLEGEFENKGTPARKIALYTQDDNRNVLDEFTLTAPKLTIKSPYTRLQNGTFKGDIYVVAPSFELRDADVEGNIYFLNNEAKETFKMDDKSNVSGERILMNIDANTSASIVIDEESFLKAVTTEENGGTWIAALLKDMKFNHPVTVEGEFENRGQTDRKIGLYSTKTLEDGTKVFTHNFTLTIPKLFINSPSFRMLNGTFNGNIYVSTDNFKLEGMTVNGNVYFTNESAFESFINLDSTINGEVELIDIDAVTSASVVTDAETFEKSISKHGVWIICLESDITTDKELVLDGDFLNKRFQEQRKVALYTQDENKNVTGEFILTAPKLTIKSPNARLQNGTFVGDIYVEAEKFQLVNTRVEGNVYFATEEAYNSFINNGEVTGEVKVLTE